MCDSSNDKIRQARERIERAERELAGARAELEKALEKARDDRRLTVDDINKVLRNVSAGRLFAVCIDEDIGAPYVTLRLPFQDVSVVESKPDGELEAGRLENSTKIRRQFKLFEVIQNGFRKLSMADVRKLLETI